jgi:hypothetical protein
VPEAPAGKQASREASSCNKQQVQGGGRGKRFLRFFSDAFMSASLGTGAGGGRQAGKQRGKQREAGTKGGERGKRFLHSERPSSSRSSRRQAGRQGEKGEVLASSATTFLALASRQAGRR